MNNAILLIDENYKFSRLTLKKIKSNNNTAIAIILGNYELNGLPFYNSKITRTEKLLSIGYDLIIEIPALIYLKSIDLLKKYLYKVLVDLNVTKLFLASENKSLASFKRFHSKMDFYYPSYDKIFHYFLNDFDYKTSSEFSKNYLKNFYQSRIYDYLNLNIIKDLIKKNIKIKLVKSSYTYTQNNELNNKYFNLIKLFFSTYPVDKVENLFIDSNTFNMLQGKLYKLDSFEKLIMLSTPKSFQFSSFFRSIILSLLFIDKNEVCEINNAFIKCNGFNSEGAKFIRKYNQNISENTFKFKSQIIPSNSSIEKNQACFELLYSYLFINKYNSNTDLFIFPKKYDKK